MVHCEKMYNSMKRERERERLGQLVLLLIFREREREIGEVQGIKNTCSYGNWCVSSESASLFIIQPVISTGHNSCQPRIFSCFLIITLSCLRGLNNACLLCVSLIK